LPAVYFLLYIINLDSRKILHDPQRYSVALVSLLGAVNQWQEKPFKYYLFFNLASPKTLSITIRQTTGFRLSGNPSAKVKIHGFRLNRLFRYSLV